MNRKKPTTELFDFAVIFINESKSTKSDSTIKNYRQAISHLKNYNPNLTFGDIDLKFYKSFTSQMSGMEFSKNTIGKFLRVLKTILNAATERGLNTNLRFREKEFHTFREDAFNVYLTSDEAEQSFFNSKTN